MTILRPVTRRIPASVQVQEETSLPLACVVSPLLGGGSSSSNMSLSSSAAASELDSERIPLAAVAKCGSCGAPYHASCPALPHKFRHVLCGLCGVPYSLDPHDQQHYRTSSSATAAAAASISDFDMSHYEERYFGSHHTNDPNRECDTEGDPTLLPEERYSLMEYSLPLFDEQQNDVTLGSLYQLPTVDCPPLLLILVDVSSSSSSSSYPNASSLERVWSSIGPALEGAPSHVHVALLFLRGGTRISRVDLSGPLAHLQHFDLNHKNDWNGNDTDHPHASESQSAVWFACLENTPLFCPMVPSHVQAALRAFGDDVVMERALDTTSRSHTPHDNYNHNGSPPIALGFILEQLLEYMEAHMCPAAGTMSGSCSTSSSSLSFLKQPYAGGKIWLFESHAPAELLPPLLEPSSSDATSHGMGGVGGSCSMPGQRFVGSNCSNSSSDNPLHTNNGTPQTNPNDSTNTKNNHTNAHGVPLEWTNEERDPESGLMASSTSPDGITTEQQQQQQQQYSMERLPPAAFVLGGGTVEAYYNELGIKCAEAAMGVEVFVVSSSDSEDPQESPYVGVPILRLLSDRSGGGGPLLLDPSIELHSYWESIQREIMARCPWTRSMAFGTLLKVRLTPSLGIDTTPNEVMSQAYEELVAEEGDSKKYTKYRSVQPVQFFKSGGMTGPVTASMDTPYLWHAGTCDDSTTVTFDMDIIQSSTAKLGKSTSVTDIIYIDGQGEIELKPCIQTCFAYTTCIQDKSTGIWSTVRRMRVLTTTMPTANTPEALFASLDAEALAVVLFHKLVCTSLQEGLQEAQTLGKRWLVSTLLCVYRSAEMEQARIEGRAFRGMASSSSSHSREFYPNERLLDREGQLTKRDVLLAQGHSRVGSLPLLVFCLLQCDALRLAGGTFYPSIDARCAAMANTGAMSPGTLARCVAPRLELWLSGKRCKAPIVDSINMSMESLKLTIAEHMDAISSSASSYSNDTDKEESGIPVPLLLVDSPQQIMVYNCLHLYTTDNMNDDNDYREHHMDMTVGSALRKAVDAAARSYHVTPPIFYILDLSETETNDASLQPFLRVQDALLEDSLTSDDFQNFEQWGTEIAELLFEELTGEED